MYPSSNINFNQNSQFFGGQINHHNIPENNNPNISKLDDFSSSNSLLHLSSPFMQYEEEDAAYELTWQQLHDLLFQQQQQQQPPMTTIATTTTTTDDEDHSMGEVIKLDFDEKSFTGSRKRTSEKDRHSKILTANGFRDRRMRLSIPVARKFFALQDLLGFDKASKTIEWLMIQSSSAIKEMRGLQQQEQVNSINSTPELEAISGIEESINNEIPQENISKKVKKTSSFNEGKVVVRLNPGSRSSCDPLTVKESRNIAREKARKRTMEKRKLGDESKESLAS